MIHFILTLVFLVLTIWLIKGATFVEYYSRTRDSEYKVPFWAAIIAFIVYSVPLMNIFVFIGFFIWFCIKAAKEPQQGCYGILIELNDKNTLHNILVKVGKFFSKPIN